MKQTETNIPDFDDLLFEKRNKEYGAYQLRRRYNFVIVASLMLGIFLVSSAVIIPFIFKPSSEHIFSSKNSYVQVVMEKFEPPVDQIIVPPEPRPPGSKTIQEIVKYIPPVIVDSMPPIELSMLTMDQANNSVPENQGEVTGTGFGDELQLGEGTGTNDEPLMIVDVMPSFKGGDINKFREWILSRTNYPQEAIDKKIKGVVFVTFVIEKDGSISNVKVLKGVNPLLDNEAVKVISGSPKWSTGLQQGQPVRVKYLISLVFSPI